MRESFCLWHPESLALESRDTTQGIRNPANNNIGIQNPSSTDKDWNPVPGIRNPQLSLIAQIQMNVRPV